MHHEKAAEPAILAAALRLLYLLPELVKRVRTKAGEKKKKKKKVNSAVSAFKQSCLNANPLTLRLFQKRFR